MKFPLNYEEPFTALIHREVFKYNRLISMIKTSLIDLQIAIDGRIQSTPYLEQLWYDLYFSHVPQAWLNLSYPTCLRNLGDFIVNLTQRVNFLKQWIDKESHKQN